MPTWKQNQELKINLKTKGWHGEIDKWPPRIPYYWHKDGLNEAGEILKHRGDIATRASSSLDHQERYANKGWFWFPPTDDCECTWCKQYGMTHPKSVEQEEQVDKAPTVVDHAHHYAGHEIGSLCTFTDCTETRQTPFMARKQKKQSKKKATVTMAEATV